MAAGERFLASDFPCDTEAVAGTSPAALHRGYLAAHFARTLGALGWFPHQPQRSVITSEPESEHPVLALSKEAQATADRIQLLFDSSVAALPPPVCSARAASVIRDEGGSLRLPFAGTERPSERTLSNTNASSSVPIWSTLVSEMAAGWASTRTGRSSGLVFLGPKDRLCYWPRLLNSLLSEVAVSYGNVLDLFSVAASFGLKFDLKSAFRALPIASDDAEFLGAIVDGIWVVFERLPFGLACSPAYFCRALEDTLSRFRGSTPSTILALGAVTVFVDDVGLSAASPEAVLSLCEHLLRALLADGWWLSISKSFCRPVTGLFFTGMTADFSKGAVAVHPSRSARLAGWLQDVSLPSEEALRSSSTPTPPSFTGGTLKAAVTAALSGPPSATLMAASVSRDVLPFIRNMVPPDGGPLRVASLGVVVPPTDDAVATSLHSGTEALSWCASSRQPALILASPEAAVGLIADLPTLSHPVVVIADVALEPTSDAAEEDLVPPHILLPDRRPPPLEPKPSQSRATSQDDLLLRPASWVALRKALGIVSWFQSVLPYLSFWRRSVDDVVKTGIWTLDARDAVVFLELNAPLLHTWARAVRPPSPQLHVVVDAGGTGWGAKGRLPSGSSVHFAGVLPPHIIPLSSTVREAWASRAALRAAFSLGIHFASVSITMDSAAAVGASSGGMRAASLSGILRSFGRYEAQGLHISFSWQSRAHGDHPVVDAISAAASSSPYHLLPDAAAALWEAVGGWDAQVHSDQQHAIAHSYTSFSLPSEARAAALRGIRPAPGASGWMGVHGDVSFPPSSTAFAFPLWSRIPSILAPMVGACSFLLITHADPTLWWSHSLAAALPSVSAVWDLPLRSSFPAVDTRSDKSAPDPRPLAAYWWRHRDWVPKQRPLPQALQGVIPARIALRGSGLGSPAETAWVRSGHCPKDRPSHTRKAPAKRVTSSGAPLSSGGSIADLLSLRRSSATAADTSSAPPCTPAGPTSGLSSILRLRGSRPPPHLDAPRESCAPPPASSMSRTGFPLPSCLPSTLGEWLVALESFAAGAPSCVDEGQGLPELAGEIAEADDCVRSKSAMGSSRPDKTIRYLRQVMESKPALLRRPFSIANVDALVTSYCVLRLQQPPPFGWTRITVNSTIASDASAITAASARAGIPLPRHCGTRTHNYLESRNALSKPEHSSAFPILISEIIRARPPLSSPHYRAWSALFVMSAFCLRTEIIFHTAPIMFVPFIDGYTFTWRMAFKRRDFDVRDPSMRSTVAHVTAAEHPLLHSILRPRGVAPTQPLFAGLTADDLSVFVRSFVRGAPASFDVRAYGTRTGADTEASELSLPPQLHDVMFWWKRETKAGVMRNYYTGQNILKMFLFSRHRLDVVLARFGPGGHAVRLTRDPPDWTKAVVSDVPLPEPYTLLLDEAWNFVPATFINRKQKRAPPSRPPPALPPHPIAPPSFPTEGSCDGCGRSIRTADPATFCDYPDCESMICAVCHSLSADFLCTDHARPVPPLKRRRGGAM